MIFYNNLPQIDLHGYDRDYARIEINDFIDFVISFNFNANSLALNFDLHK